MRKLEPSSPAFPGLLAEIKQDLETIDKKTTEVIGQE